MRRAAPASVPTKTVIGPVRAQGRTGRFARTPVENLTAQFFRRSASRRKQADARGWHRLLHQAAFDSVIATTCWNSVAVRSPGAAALAASMAALFNLR